MGGFITSRSLAKRHDVYAEERKPPAIIQAVGTGVAALVGQFPWGPDTTLIKPTSPADRGNIIAPRGMDRTGSGYLSTIQKAFPTLYLARVLGSAAAAASVTLQQAATTDIITITLKYKGTAGNSVDAVVSAASDGDANHFNLRVFVENEDGVTEDIFENLNYSGTGADSDPVLTNALLVGSIVKANDGVPDAGSSDFAGGLDGTIDSGRYIGTPGTGNLGMALFENDKSIRTVFCDDPGNSLRDAVNDALIAHCDLMGDRICVLSGNSGQTASGVQTDVANYRSDKAVYADPWFYQRDERGTERLIPMTSMAASVIAQTSPSTSPAMKDSVRQSMLRGIVRLETPRGAAAGTNTEAGIMTAIQEETGGWTFEAGVLTIAPSDPAKKRITRTRMGQYIAASVTRSLRSSVDQPNVPILQQDVVNAVDRFMAGLKRARDINPIGLPHVVDYYIAPLDSVNTPESIAAGDFTIPLDVQTSAGMERIFLSVQYGENVVILQAA